MSLQASDSFIEIANAALSELGVETIENVDQPDIRGRTVNRSFIDAQKAALSMHPWRFARAHRTLNKVSETPPPPFVASYQLPSDTLLVHRVYEGDQSVVFDRFGWNVAIVTQALAPEEVTAELTQNTDPAQWPGYFREFFILYYAARLAMPITQDMRVKAELERQAKMAVRLARSRDSQGRTPPRIDTKMFIRARRGGRR